MRASYQGGSGNKPMEQDTPKRRPGDQDEAEEEHKPEEARSKVPPIQTESASKAPTKNSNIPSPRPSQPIHIDTEEPHIDSLRK